MILPRPGKWKYAWDRWFIWERLFDIRVDTTPTIWCRVSLRYLKTQKQMSQERAQANKIEALKAVFIKKPTEITQEELPG